MEHLEKYLEASKEEKSKIIDAVKTITGMHCKAVIRAFGREQMRSALKPKEKPGPNTIYTNDVTAALKEICRRYPFFRQLVCSRYFEKLRFFSFLKLR